MNPTLNASGIDYDFDMSSLLDTPLHTIELSSAWLQEFGLDIFDDQLLIEENSLSREEDLSEPSTFPQLQESSEIFIKPSASQTFDESLASSNTKVIHTIEDTADNQYNIQEDESSWENDLTLQPLLQVPENLSDYEINSSTSLSIDISHASAISSETQENAIIPNIEKANDVTTVSDTASKKRKTVGKPSTNILQKKLKISPPSVEVTTPTTSKPTRTRKTKKIAKRPHDKPAKIGVLKEMNTETFKYQITNRLTNKTNTICEAVMRDNDLSEDFATISIQMEKDANNQVVGRRVCYKKSAIFQSKFNAFLKNKVIEMLKVGNIVTSEHYIVEYEYRIIISIRVRNTCLIGPEIANEIAKLCDMCLSNDVMIVFSGNT